jgi:hypothetical protein
VLVVPSPKFQNQAVILEDPGVERSVKVTSSGRSPVTGSAEKSAVGPILGLTRLSLPHPTRRKRTARIARDVNRALGARASTMSRTS